jgi:ribosome-associated toxin RatA of RatAB toxin-antitoxin module
MRKVCRSALVPYSAAEMFALVDNPEAYPEFLPWCGAAEEHLRDAQGVEATIEFHKHGIRRLIRTRNSNLADESIDIQLVDGPFRYLHGRWQFQDLGGAGCKVSLEMQFEFSNRLVSAVFGRAFEDTCNSLVQAFTVRAAEVYGPRQIRNA